MSSSQEAEIKQYPLYPQVKVSVNLQGPGGNVYVIMAAVTSAMKAAGLHKEAQAFKRGCFQQSSYKAVLHLCRITVTFEEELSP